MQTLKIMVSIAITNLAKLYTNYYTKFQLIVGNFKDIIGVMNNCPSIKKGIYKPTVYLPSAMT